MVKGCFYASELVQGCSKVRFSPFSMAKRSVGDGVVLAHFWSEDGHIWPKCSPSMCGPWVSLPGVLEEVAFSTSEWSKSRSLVKCSIYQWPRLWPLGGRKCNFFQYSWQWNPRPTHGWRAFWPNISLLTSKMSEQSSWRDGDPVIPFLNIMTFEQPWTSSEA